MSTYDPPDADHSYNVKVMLLSAPPPEDLYEKTCHFADSGKSFAIFCQKYRLTQQIGDWVWLTDFVYSTVRHIWFLI